MASALSARAWRGNRPRCSERAHSTRPRRSNDCALPRWETTLDERRRADPGIDDPARRGAARKIRNARDIGYHLAQMRGMTQAEVAGAMGVSQARVSRMEHGDIERMQVESIAAYVAAIGGHLRLVADFDQATTTFVDYTDALTA